MDTEADNLIEKKESITKAVQATAENRHHCTLFLVHIY